MANHILSSDFFYKNLREPISMSYPIHRRSLLIGMSNESFFAHSYAEVVSQKKEGIVLVHGYVTPELGDGRVVVSWDTSCAIAWVIYDNTDRVWIPDYSGYTQDQFEKVFLPTFVRTYSWKKAQLQYRSYGTYGPWEPVLQRGRLLGPDGKVRPINTTVRPSGKPMKLLRKTLLGKRRKHVNGS